MVRLFVALSGNAFLWRRSPQHPSATFDFPVVDRRSVTTAIGQRISAQHATLHYNTTNQRMHAESSSVSWAMVAQPLGPGDPDRSPRESDNGSVNPWRESIERMYAARTNAAGTESRPIFSPPASVLDVEAAENSLAARFPETLKSLLLESDGIMDQLSVDGGSYFDNMWLLWPAQQIVDENMGFRKRISETNSDRAGRDFVFIASAGVDGILFGMDATDKPRDDSPIVAWYPIGHRICGLADTLAGFLDGWLCNRIAV